MLGLILNVAEVTADLLRYRKGHTNRIKAHVSKKVSNTYVLRGTSLSKLAVSIVVNMSALYLAKPA